MNGVWRNLWVLMLPVLVGCAPFAQSPQSVPSAQAFEQGATWDAFEPQLLARAIFLESNRVRSVHGLRRLRTYPRLERAADLQAFTTAMLGFPSHSNPLAGRSNVFERVVAAGLQPGRVGENVATTPLQFARPDDSAAHNRSLPSRASYRALAERIVQQWLDSPPHRAALLDRRYTYLACATALSRGPLGQELVFSVQVFFSPRTEHRS